MTFFPLLRLRLINEYRVVFLPSLHCTGNNYFMRAYSVNYLALGGESKSVQLMDATIIINNTRTYFAWRIEFLNLTDYVTQYRC